MAFWYPFLKTLHVLGVISWMAGLLYLFRFFVYHSAETEGVVMERFRLMERRLWLAITVPAAWIAVGSGVAILVLTPCFLLPAGWMTVKLVLGLGMLWVHFLAGHYRKAFLEPPFPLSEKAFRFLNEVPTLLMIGIVTMVIFRPNLWLWPICQG